MTINLHANSQFCQCCASNRAWLNDHCFAGAKLDPEDLADPKRLAGDLIRAFNDWTENDPDQATLASMIEDYAEELRGADLSHYEHDRNELMRVACEILD